MLRISGIALIVALGAGTGPATADGADGADGDSWPYIDGEIVIEVQNDWSYRSDDRDAELNDLFTTTEPTVNFHLFPGLTVTAHGVLEPVRDPRPHDDRFFGDHGFFVEDLFASYETAVYEENGDRLVVEARGGKFTPGFGIAWDAAPGVYGSDFAEDSYEFAERIAVGGSVNFSNDRVGSHTLSGSSFFLDTSGLGASAITGRGRTSLRDGGVGNTQGFSSFALALDGSGLPALPALSWHIGYIHQSRADIPDLASGAGMVDETGVAIAAQLPFSLDTDIGDVEITPLVEYVHFNDADGVNGQQRRLLTTSVQAGWEGWNLALSHTGRHTDIPGGPDDNDFLFQISGGYEFDFGLTVDVGWRLTNEAHIEQRIVGALVGYRIEF